MEATMEARDADPVASEAAPVHDLHGPLVMGAKIPGGDDGHCQNLRIGDVRTPPVPPARGGGATPQAFHHGVNHDKSGYYRASDRRLLLAAMVGLTTAIVPEMSVDVN